MRAYIRTTPSGFRDIRHHLPVANGYRDRDFVAPPPAARKIERDASSRYSFSHTTGRKMLCQANVDGPIRVFQWSFMLRLIG